MSEIAPHEKDSVEEFAKELANKLPVKEFYEDAVAPAAQEVGRISKDIIKTIMLALAPFQVAAAYQDRFREFIDRSVRRVPQANRIPPPPQILGPIVEGMRYEPENTNIADMFSQLLSCSMDQNRVKYAIHLIH
jgi:hypothetical protein